MLLFGADPLYLSYLPTYASPHNFQVLLEVGLDSAVAQVLRADREQHGDGLYTVDPAPFPIAELAPHDGTPLRTTFEGTLVRGHFERGGTPVATDVRFVVRHVVSFGVLDVDAKHEPGDGLRYLCFGRAGQLYLAHELRARPSFDQVLRVRLIPGTVRTGVGHPLPDDAAAIGFDDAQRVEVGRADDAKQRLVPGEVVGASLPLTRSPSFARGFQVQMEIERQRYLEIDELA